MANKDNFYFNNFIQCADKALETANVMCSILTQFGVDLLPKQVEQIHVIEHSGDMLRHELVHRVTKDFITPLERDDIIKLSNAIDSITDSIEDVIINIYINNETKIREDSLDFARLIVEICKKVKKLMEELPNFRRSTVLQQIVTEVHRTEEDGDKLYMKCMKKLHGEETDPLSVMAWKDVYSLLENCCDTCADVADIVEGIAISNI